MRVRFPSSLPIMTDYVSYKELISFLLPDEDECIEITVRDDQLGHAWLDKDDSIKLRDWLIGIYPIK